MTVKLRKKQKPNAVSEKTGAPEQDLENMYYELATVTSEIKDLTDADLYDRCMLYIQTYQRHDLDVLYDKLAIGDKLTAKERKDVESFYILADMNFAVMA